MGAVKCINDKPNRVQEGKDSIEQAIQRIANMTDEAKQSQAIRQHLACMASFHGYSFQNQMLIRAQRPDATLVKGYRQWTGHNRFVVKGAKGIAILVPMWPKGTKHVKVTLGGEEEGEVVKTGQPFFAIGYVFDVSDTDGEPLPLADVTGHNGTDTAYETLAAAAIRLGYDVQFKELGETNGCHYRGTNKIDLNGSRTVAEWAETLAHEMGHAILHNDTNDKTLTRSAAETEAEAVAYAVMSHFGCESQESAAYIALWRGDSKEIKARMSRIAIAAHRILEACEHVENWNTNEDMTSAV